LRLRVNSAFIHIGKTGGSTLCLVLRHACHSFVRKPCPSKSKNLSNETYASLLSTYYHVPDFTNGKLSKIPYEFYIFSIRDPLLRTISAFLYEHPENKIAEETYKHKITSPGAKQKFAAKIRPSVVKGKQYFYYDCFPTLEDFALYLGNYTPAPNKNANDCAKIAKKIFTINSRNSHLFWNFENVMSLTKKGGNNGTADTLLVRNEFKWRDWITANRWLGQEGFIATYPRSIARNSQAYSAPITKDLSSAGKENICRALKKEYSIYFELLKKAVNLSSKDKQDSLQIARDNCPNLHFEIN